MVRIDIVMSTFNAGSYLDDQIRSIVEQSDSGWRLMIRDDGSSDQTPETIRKWTRNDKRIINRSDSDGNLGVTASYSRLLSQTDAEIVMISDQDDIWKPDRVRSGRNQLTGMVELVGGHLPLLVHSDLELINESGERIAESFWKYQGLNPGRTRRFLDLLVQNAVTGCTMTVNRSLLRKALPIPEDAIMYDCWMGLVASLWGNIHTGKEPLICYRQHDANFLGAQRYGHAYIMRKMLKFYDRDALRRSISAIVRQASCFLDRYSTEIPSESRDGLEFLARLDRAGFIEKRYGLIRYRLWKTGLARNLGWFLRV